MFWDSDHNPYASFNIDAMAMAHSHLIEERGLNEGHFDAFAGHLEESLRECGAAPAVVLALMDKVRRLRVAFQTESRSEAPGGGAAEEAVVAKEQEEALARQARSWVRILRINLYCCLVQCSTVDVRPVAVQCPLFFQSVPNPSKSLNPLRLSSS